MRRPAAHAFSPLRPFLLICSLLLLAACSATLSSPEAEGIAIAAPTDDPGDPFEMANRERLADNLWVYRNFLRPMAEAYVAVVPGVVRQGVTNMLANMSGPRIFINDVLQGEAGRALETAGRFLINTVAGVGGIVDVAAYLGIKGHDEDFGQTLAVWGVGGDPYLVLPVLGPSNTRDAFGHLVDIAIDPVNYFFFPFMLVSRYGAMRFDRAVRTLDTVDTILNTSLDFYVTLRTLYRQNRRFQISNTGPMPDADIFGPLYMEGEQPAGPNLFGPLFEDPAEAPAE